MKNREKKELKWIVRILIVIVMVCVFFLGKGINGVINSIEGYKVVSEKTVVNMEEAERMAIAKYGNINDFNVISNNIKIVVKKYEEDSNYNIIEIEGRKYIENSYLYLVLVSIARQESNFKQSAIGLEGEIGEFQLMPRTVRYLLDKEVLPITKNKKEKLKSFIKKNNTTIALFYLMQHLDKYNDLVLATSRYNGDMKTKKYGKKIKVRFSSLFLTKNII